MNRAVLALAAALALSGCDRTTDEPRDPPPEPLAGEATFQMGPGLYSVGDAETAYARTRLNTDGTYVDMTLDGEQVGGGTWTTRSDMICFDPVGDGKDEAERCWTNDTPNPDGNFMTHRVGSDESYLVTPLGD